MPRLGLFLVPPTGPGAYSFLDAAPGRSSGRTRRSTPTPRQPDLVLVLRRQLDLPPEAEQRRSRLRRRPQVDTPLRRPDVDDRRRIPLPVPARRELQQPPQRPGRLVRPDPDARVRRPVVQDRLRVYSGRHLTPTSAAARRRRWRPTSTAATCSTPSSTSSSSSSASGQPGLRPGRPAGAAVRLAAARQPARLGQHPADVPGVQGVHAGRKSGTSTCSCVQPVAARRPSQFDTGDNNQIFSGAWPTYRPKAGQTHRPVLPEPGQHQPRRSRPARTGPGGVQHQHRRRAVRGTTSNWLWDFEGMLQFGN